MSVLLFKIIIAVGCSISTLVVLGLRKPIDRLNTRQQGVWLGLAFVLLRIVPFIVVYLVGQQEPRSDVPVFYDAAVQALQGKMVYRDFWTPYSPLFPYVTTLLLPLWNSAKAVVLLMILMEGLTLWLTWRTYQTERRDLFLRLITYLTLAGPLVLCVLGGQEDIWMWLFGVLSVMVWQRTRDSFWIGVVMALALIITKALAVLIVVPLVLLVEKPVRYVVGLAVTGLPALVLLVWLVGDKFLTPLAFAGADLPFAPNLWTVLSPLIGDFRPYAKPLSWIGILLTLGVTSLGALMLKQRLTYPRSLPILWTLCFCFMMFFHKSSFSNYAFIFLMPMLVNTLNLRDSTQVLALLVFNAAVVVQPTYWWGLGNPIFTAWSDLASATNLIEYGLEWIIVGCLVYFLTRLYGVIGHGTYQHTSEPAQFPLSR